MTISEPIQSLKETHSFQSYNSASGLMKIESRESRIEDRTEHVLEGKDGN